MSKVLTTAGNTSGVGYYQLRAVWMEYCYFQTFSDGKFLHAVSHYLHLTFFAIKFTLTDCHVFVVLKAYMFGRLCPVLPYMI